MYDIAQRVSARRSDATARAAMSGDASSASRLEGRSREALLDGEAMLKPRGWAEGCAFRPAAMSR